MSIAVSHIRPKIQASGTNFTVDERLDFQAAMVAGLQARVQALERPPQATHFRR